MNSIEIEKFDNEVYNITLNGKFDITQSFDILKSEINELLEIKKLR